MSRSQTLTLTHSLICKYPICMGRESPDGMSDTGESRQSFICVILEAAVHSFVLGDCIPKHFNW